MKSINRRSWFFDSASLCQPHAYMLPITLHDGEEKEYRFSYHRIVRVKPLLVLKQLIEEADELNF